MNFLVGSITYRKDPKIEPHMLLSPSCRASHPPLPILGPRMREIHLRHPASHKAGSQPRLHLVAPAHREPLLFTIIRINYANMTTNKTLLLVFIHGFKVFTLLSSYLLVVSRPSLLRHICCPNTSNVTITNHSSPGRRQHIRHLPPTPRRPDRYPHSSR